MRQVNIAIWEFAHFALDRARVAASTTRGTGAKGAPLLLAAAVVALFAACPMTTLAQNVHYTNKAIDLGQRGDLRVNPATQALEMQIPLGSYPGRAGNSLPVTLSYSSKTMRIDFAGYNPGHFTSHGQPVGDSYTMVVARYAEHSAAGWISSLGFPVIDSASASQAYDNSGNPCMPSVNCGNGALTWFVNRIQVRMGDGSSHELRTTDQPSNGAGGGGAGDYYTVDGSRMRYQASTQTLFMSDGSHYLLAAGQHIDRNGNILYATNGSADTLGRSIQDPCSSWGSCDSPGATSGDFAYSLPGVGGANITYTFKWRHLGDTGVLTTSEALQYTADSGCPLGNGSFSPHLFLSDSSSRTCITNANTVFNPVVLNQIVLPTGQTYTFTYNIYGEIDKVVLPTGGYERYVYQQIPPLSSMSIPYTQANRGIVSRFVSASGSGTDEVQWQYSVGSVTAPDGTLTKALIYGDGAHGWGYSSDGSRSGRAYDEQVYSAPDGSGNRQMLRRKLTEWTMTGSNSTSPSIPWANRNARVTKEVDILLDTSGNALAKTTTYQYDTTYEFSTGVNMSSMSEYSYVSVDQTTAQTGGLGSFALGILLRTTEKDYLDSNSAYRNLNILGLVGAVRIKDATGNIVAQSTVSYDETAYPIISLGTVTSWTDPGTTVRGNATSTGAWLNTSNTYLTKHVQYDQCGSARNTWDGNGNLTQIDYTDGFSDSVARNTYAYATKITSAIPDPTGVHGSTSSLVTSMVFDFSTGKGISSTDANGQTTTLAYTDSLNRLTSITRPTGGGSTIYIYTDTPGSLSLQSQTAQDAITTIYDFTYFDGVGRPTRSAHGEGSNSWINRDTQYDNMGRVSQNSNAYRQGVDTPVWTTIAYDALGRVTTVLTPDGAHTDTLYNVNIVNVTDQAGNQRSSITDALGRLIQVTEAPNVASCQSDGSGCQTTYSYDVLGNLTGVQQGGQARTYAFDSLGRLITANNAENGAVSYQYDNDGKLTAKTDPRAITTTFSYDALNRIITKIYSDSTPAVSYYYDNAGLPSGAPSYSRGFTSGRLVAVTYGGGSSGNYYGYNNLGRVALKTQQTDGLNYAVSASYNLNGALISETYPSGRTIAVSYDGAGRLSGMQSNGNAVLSGVAYTAHGALLNETYGNSLYHSIQYNTRLQPTRIMLGSNSTTSANYLDLQYGYGGTNNNGDVLTETIGVQTATLSQVYSYDSLNRVTGAQETSSGAGWSQTFSYDRFGNRTVQTSSAGLGTLTPSPGIDAATNRYTAGNGFTYDSAGNITQEPAGSLSSRFYSYDAENHLIKASQGTTLQGATPVGLYAYDGDGRRIKKTTADNIRLIYDIGGRIAAEYDTNTSLLKKEYIYGVNGLLATMDASNIANYVTSDMLGSTRAVTGASGAIVGRHDYAPFGEEIAVSFGGRNALAGYGGNDSLRQKFTGKERDAETGLDFFEARYYSSAQGRFTTMDPTLLSVNGLNPQTWNRYVYVMNNPLLYVDPYGLWAIITEEVYKKNKKDGSFKLDKNGHKILDHINLIAVQTQKDDKGQNKDDGASLAKQLGLKNKDAEKFAAKVGNANNVRLANQGGEVGRVFEAAESGITEQAKWSTSHPGESGGPQSSTYNDCAMTTCRIAFPSQMSGIHGSGPNFDFGVNAADALIKGLPSVSKDSLAIGDIVRYADGDTPTHFMTVLYTDDNNVTQAFSRSGVDGKFEIIPVDKFVGGIYGNIKGKESNETGFYRPPK